MKDFLESGIDLTGAKTLTLNNCFFTGIDLREREGTIRASTRVNYENMWNHNIFEFGKQKAADITALQVRKLVADFNQRGLSKATVKILYCLLSQAFDDAIANNLRKDNPCHDKTVKTAKKSNGNPAKDREALTPDQQKRLLSFVEKSNVYAGYYDFLVIALYTGLRVGELTGLIWDDVDLWNGFIKIERQLRYGKASAGDKSHFYIADTKTEAGNRKVYFGDEVRDALIRLKKANFALGKTQSGTTVDGVTGFLFLNMNGTPYATNAVNFILKNFVEAYNRKNPEMPLPHISAHILRHSYATRAVENDMDHKALQNAMGHAQIGATMDTYARPNDEEWKRREMLKVSKAN